MSHEHRQAFVPIDLYHGPLELFQINKYVFLGARMCSYMFVIICILGR